MFAFLTALLFNAVTGAAFGAVVGVSPVAGALGMNAISAVVGTAMPSGVMRAGVLKEIWTGEMVKALREFLVGSWLDGIPDNSSLVDNDVIHLVDVGVDPDVLVNNTTYPIPLQNLNDADITISLDKFQTKVTPVTDDELYAISYDKISRVKESHSNAINDSKFAKAAHALCATSHTAKTPVPILCIHLVSIWYTKRIRPIFLAGKLGPLLRIYRRFVPVVADVVVDLPVLDDHNAAFKWNDEVLRQKQLQVIVCASNHPLNFLGVVQESVIIRPHR